MTLFGQASLVARRLLEAGTQFVTVLWDEFELVNSAWDTHFYHYELMREQLCPGLDRACSALVLDLEDRGMLDDTLIVVTTEHGRTPKLENVAGGGRGHWAQAYSTLLIGGGVAQGKVVGRTDRIAGSVQETPVSPKDILATMYHLLGIDPGNADSRPLGPADRDCGGRKGARGVAGVDILGITAAKHRIRSSDNATRNRYPHFGSLSGQPACRRAAIAIRER